MKGVTDVRECERDVKFMSRVTSERCDRCERSDRIIFYLF